MCCGDKGSVVKIVYMGTPEFAVAPLRHLAKSQFDVVGVVTGADKPSGRGRKLTPTPVHVVADELKLTTLTPESLRDPLFHDRLRSLDADAFVVIAFRILPPEVYEMPRLGAINAHASLLPQYRGSAPIAWALINGEAETGLTTFVITRTVDTGGVIMREKVAIADGETATTLGNRLSSLAGPLVEKSLEALAHGTQLEKQDDTKATVAPKLTPELCVIDWRRDRRTVVNLIRGLADSPAAVSSWRGGRVKILGACTASETSRALEPGETLATGGRLFVGAGNGAIEILLLRPEGRATMSAAEFVNGFQPHERERFTMVGMKN